MMQKPKVAILMGSDSDFPVMEESLKVFDAFDIPYEVVVTSAHRSPERTSQYARSAKERGLEALIVGAGAAAALAGVVAAETSLPVIGVPIDASPLNGIDALYATVMMPGGIPVATMAVGKAGAKNAALFAIAMFAVGDADISEKLTRYRRDMAEKVRQKSDDLQKRLNMRER